MADKLDGSAIVANTIPGTKIQSGTITTAQLDPAIATAVNTPLHPKISSLSYPGDDLAANTGGGDSIVINGSGFGTNVQVYINNNAVPSLVRNNANAITITTAAQAAGTYLVYLINTDDGGTAILVPGIQYSGTPTWVTTSPLDSQQALSAWSISLSATGDSPIVYTLQAGSSLPDGITLAANGLISGTMTSPPSETTTYNFTVVATDPQLQDTPKAFSVSVTIVDPQFQYTTLLLSGNGTNNQNNHTFLDSSNNNFTITRFGNATQGTFSPFSQTGWSNYFDGSGDYLAFPTGQTPLAFGSSNFTIEAWVYRASGTSTAVIFGGQSDLNSAAGSSYVLYVTSSATTSDVYIGSTGYSVTSPNPPVGIWSHVAFVRTGGTLSTYLNGSRVGTRSDLGTGSVNAGSTTYAASIGATVIGGSPLNGYVSNLRIIKGSGGYDATQTTITVPTTPLTAITNTSLLTCQSNRFRDASTNNFAITRNGDASVQAFSPFAPTASYAAANVGGSIYLDGTGDYVQVASSSAFAFNTGTFTVEFWYYPTKSPDQWDTLFGSSGGNGIFFSCRSGFLDWTNNNDNAALIRSNWPTLFQWSHIALVQNSSSRSVFINGVRTGTAAIYSWEQGSVSLGNESSGYFSDWRVIMGQAIYDPSSTTITIPTAPLTAIANTSLLANFTNAGITDATAKNVLETVGDAKISTVQSKFGGSSMFFDGTGDYVQIQPTPNLEFESGDFTIEMWLYTAITTRMAIYHGSSGTDWSIGIDYDNQRFRIWASSNGTSWNLINADGGGNGIGTISLPLNQWNHVAFVRYGTTWQTYVNGIRDLNLTGISGSIINRATSAKSLGKWFFSNGVGTPGVFNGYIDDLRITKGIARYVQNFTPPTSAFLTR